MEEDEIELVDDKGPIEFTSSDKAEGKEEQTTVITRVGEENHAQSVSRHRLGRRGLSNIKQRLANRDSFFTKREKQVAWIVTVALLGLAALLLLAVPLLIDTNLNHEQCRDFVELSFGEEYEEFPYLFSDGNFELCRRGDTVLKGKLGTNHSYLSEVKVDIYSYSNNTLLNTTRLSDNCLKIEWVGMSSRQYPLSDCFELGTESFWFAAYEVSNQTWAINNASFPRTSFVPKDYLSPLEREPHVFGPLLHPLWLSSNGVGIHVDPQVQLYVSMENNHLCLYALPFELECAPGAANETSFNYTVCVFNTAAQTAKYFLADSGVIPHAAKQPNNKVLVDPIWSTSNIETLNATSLQSFYDNIISNSFNISMLRIEEGYSLHDGDLLVQSSLVTKLLNLSQKVNISVWVHPFVDYSTSNFTQDINQDFYLPSLSEIEGNSVSLVRWWRGYAAVINFLNDTVREKQAGRLEHFVQSNLLTSLSFDGGEYTYLPKCVYTENLVHPADYVKAYVRMVGNASYSASASVRVGYFTQDQPIFVRLLDRDFSWGEDNGLRSVLNAVLSLGLGGYPFVIPNKVGGNLTSITSARDKDLYLRWVELNAFLPVMEFGYLPWSTGDRNLLSVVNDMTALHKKLISEPSFQDALSDATSKGYPIVRPLWWVADPQATTDITLFTISDQFLVGDKIMVAPILFPNTTNRDVYFPQNTQWKVERPSSATSTCTPPCQGGTRNFNVPLNEVLYFTRVD